MAIEHTRQARAHEVCDVDLAGGRTQARRQEAGWWGNIRQWRVQEVHVVERALDVFPTEADATACVEKLACAQKSLVKPGRSGWSTRR